MEHGGDINSAAEEFGIPAHLWLDLSTAISPYSYPLSSVPASAWQRLSYLDPGLLEAASAYYNCQRLLPLAGSQQAIQLLPQCFSQLTVAVPHPGYSEHAKHWRLNGHECLHYRNEQELQQLIAKGWLDAVVLINPNNPSAEQWSRDAVLELADRLAEQGSWLLVDEAFIDVMPQHSVMGDARPNLLVMRSLGKFFGLAGIRMGFLTGPQHVLSQLGDKQVLWQHSGPAQWAAKQALTDVAWQQQQRQRLQMQASILLQRLQSCFGQQRCYGHPLFISVELPLAIGQQVYQRFAQSGILIRLFELDEEHALLRFGLLPEGEEPNQRFYGVLAQCRELAQKPDWPQRR